MMMDDLISRQAAIGYFVTNFGIVDEDGYKVDDYDEIVKIWTEYFSGVPSADPEPKWILVSEALPEDLERVLVSIKRYGRENRSRSGHYFRGYFMMDNGDTWNSTDKNVLAWMPLPEPYQGGE